MTIYEKWIETGTALMENAIDMMKKLNEGSSLEEKKFYTGRICQELETAAKSFYNARLEIISSDD